MLAAETCCSCSCSFWRKFSRSTRI